MIEITVKPLNNESDEEILKTFSIAMALNPIFCSDKCSEDLLNKVIGVIGAKKEDKDLLLALVLKTLNVNQDKIEQALDTLIPVFSEVYTLLRELQREAKDDLREKNSKPKMQGVDSKGDS